MQTTRRSTEYYSSRPRSVYVSYNEKQENKLKCIIHYFERICSSMPEGKVSFERKVLPLEQSPFCIPYPKDHSWSKSMVLLCPFEVCSSGLIEDQSKQAIEVDFANSFLGGGALNRGCVQEEIRFMINPELIVGMLFLPSMADNEAIEIVGAERFSHYTGYASSFRFCGDYVDKRGVDFIGRRKTRITAIDALINPGRRQYGLECLTREINKAFCGFFNQSKYLEYQKIFQNDVFTKPQLDIEGLDSRPINSSSFYKATSTSQTNKDLQHKLFKKFDGDQDIGIVTGNWGSGAFGGDPELKAIIQWVAASQALRPFISYYTFGLDALQKLDEVTKWIITHEWTVGDLWDMLVEYCSQRLNGETEVGFFSWLLPCFTVHHDPMMLDTPPAP